jgi:hypothetical protein
MKQPDIKTTTFVSSDEVIYVLRFDGRITAHKEKSPWPASASRITRKRF